MKKRQFGRIDGSPVEEIVLESGEAAVAIAIADNGPGMSPEQLIAAQDVFYTTKPQGSGLGLAVVKSVTLAHGGHFRLQSRLGVGTCGVLTIPLTESYESAH